MINRKERTYGLASYILYFIIGLLFVVIPSATLKDMIFVFVGIVITLTSLFPTIYFFNLASHDNRFYTPAIASFVSLIIGIMFIFWHNFVLSIILGVVLIVLPVIRIIFSENKWREFKRQIPYFVLATLLFFIPFDAILGVVFKVFGGLLMAISLLGIVLVSIAIRKEDKANQNHDDNNHDDFNKRDLIDVEVREL